ncbi:phosphoglycolate phosphatase [uncultured Pseudacidovorax sp.]|uniref:phosphoglycolate phosphatase n=1 Tax=uncultured Pseudacidovorax sp. TaxID=679313 RepID=UPI0025FC00D3|nr:phosphoglycolate phosphatase [uncultured Pseudacidovorax sp.]
MTAPFFDRSSLDAAIVDLDGTMVDTLGDFAAALGGMLQDLSLPPIEADVIGTLVGKGSEHLIRAVLQQVGAPSPEALFGHAWTRYQHHYLAINGRHSTVYPGVAEGLAALRAQGLRLACLTNKPLAFARPLLAAKGLDGFFDHVFGGDSFARKKPDPLPVLLTCEALGSAPGRTLAIGDSSNDAQAARAAGCRVVLVGYGYNHGRPVREVPADAYLDSLADLRFGTGATAP